MIWGLITSIFSGLSVDLKIFRKEANEDKRLGYSGYSGKIDFLTPKFASDTYNILAKMNEKLAQANSATLTIFLCLVMLFLWLSFGQILLRRIKRKNQDVETDVEIAKNEVNHLQGKLAELEDEKTRRTQFENTKKMILNYIPASMRPIRNPNPAIALDTTESEDGTLVNDREATTSTRGFLGLH